MSGRIRLCENYMLEARGHPRALFMHAVYACGLWLPSAEEKARSGTGESSFLLIDITCPIV